MKKKYTGFTLVEMLIVMGILSVLMAIGVSVARFAIQRANNIQHQSAVDQMFQALQSHYTDNRAYPTIAAGCVDTDGDGLDDNFCGFDESLLLGSGVLDKYVDANFDGGSPSQFYYIINSSESYPQTFLVCASYADFNVARDSAEGQGGYCNGNGFGIVAGGAITKKTMDNNTEWVTAMDNANLGTLNSDWVSGDWNGNGWE